MEPTESIGTSAAATRSLASFLEPALAGIVLEHGDRLCELRLRVERPAMLRLIDGSEVSGDVVTRAELHETAARMMEDSLYAREDELRQGYFTMTGGLRVGVCGSIGALNGAVRAISAVSSLCVRIPRQVPGCGEALWHGVPESLLILSPPGLGKTTMARDVIRLASNAGFNVAVADERRELAACREGVPQFDLGCRADVMDNCPKHIAIPMLLRACAPDIIVVDEIGDARDAAALLEASRCGVYVVATAHAPSFEAAEARFPGLMGSVFTCTALLGPRPGQLMQIRQYDSARTSVC